MRVAYRFVILESTVLQILLEFRIPLSITPYFSKSIYTAKQSPKAVLFSQIQYEMAEETAEETVDRR